MVKRNKKIELLALILLSLISIFSLQCGNSVQASETENRTDSMNFKQIKKGNYTSLKGKWELVGLAYNTYGADNNYGTNWQKISKSLIGYNQLKIYKNKIQVGAETFRRNTLKLKHGPKMKLKYRYINNHLIAEASNGIYYSIEFLPKTVHFENKIGGKLPYKIVDGKDKIVLFSSSLGGVWVYQRK